MTVEEAIIGVLGAGILGVFGLFMTSVKSDIRALGERMDRSEAVLTEVKEKLAVIVATQAVHGRILDEHGRILKKHSQILNEHSRTLDEHSRILNEHSRILDEHSRILDEHSRTLEKHGRILDEHSRILDGHSRTLAGHGRMLVQVLDYGERITALEVASGAG
jgi:ABC-type transporter Mla subunit MlaD